MDDFRIGSTSPYAAYQDTPRPAGSNRKKAKRPESKAVEEELIPEQSAASDPETEEDLGVQDCYTPSDRTEEAE